jgi:hypothetical protein
MSGFDHSLTATPICGNVIFITIALMAIIYRRFLIRGIEVSAPERNFFKDTNLNTILIDKNDLLKLNELIKTAFSEEDIRVKISTDYDNIRINTESIDDFLTLNGMPDKLGRLEINIYGNEKYINIMLADYRMHLSISGKDETWVLGTFHKLSTFFNDKKPWFRSRKIPVSIYLILIAIMGGITVYFYFNRYLISALLFTIMVVFSYYLLFTSIFDKYFPSFELRLSPKRNIINKEMIIIVLTVLTLIATIIGGIFIPLLKN